MFISTFGGRISSVIIIFDKFHLFFCLLETLEWMINEPSIVCEWLAIIIIASTLGTKNSPRFSHPNRFSPPLILCNTIRGFKWDNQNNASVDNLKIRYLSSRRRRKCPRRKIIIRYFVTNGCTARGRIVGRQIHPPHVVRLLSMRI